ncbi:hypothetical protein [Mycoplasmopsis cricetuli]|uniref:hypothetical protein n=1 Tax=Mycoplasmopsis cricetuli TaxID=171283 RepID=UPI0012EB2023|nr:hypothetical protein [Mycoplasmopsis cricetuli]
MHKYKWMRLFLITSVMSTVSAAGCEISKENTPSNKTPNQSAAQIKESVDEKTSADNSTNKKEQIDNQINDKDKNDIKSNQLNIEKQLLNDLAKVKLNFTESINDNDSLKILKRFWQTKSPYENYIPNKNEIPIITRIKGKELGKFIEIKIPEEVPENFENDDQLSSFERATKNKLIKLRKDIQKKFFKEKIAPFDSKTKVWDFDNSVTNDLTKFGPIVIKISMLLYTVDYAIKNNFFKSYVFDILNGKYITETENAKEDTDKFFKIASLKYGSLGSLKDSKPYAFAHNFMYLKYNYDQIIKHAHESS